MPTTIPAAAGAPWPAGPVLAANGIYTFHSGGAGNAPDASEVIAAQPRGFGVDVVKRDPSTGADVQNKQITVTYSTHRDVTNVKQTYKAFVSGDSGATFAPDDNIGQDDFLEVGQLLDGRLLGVRFEANTDFIFNSAKTAITFDLILRTSADKGKTWVRQSAVTTITDNDLPANLPTRKVESIFGVNAIGRPIQMTNGAVVLPISFNMGAVSFQSVMVATPPAGSGSSGTSAPWVFTMRPVTSHGTYSFGESAVVERQDGALLAVTRGDYGSMTSKLSYKVSTDLGQTWSPFADVTFDDQPGCAVYGVSPRLALMPNGLLVLSSGRPDNWMAISTDPSGTKWTQEQTTYRNRNNATASTNWWWGSSGYTSLVTTGANKLVQFTDNCAAPNAKTGGSNGCKSNTSADYDRTNVYRLVNRQISTLTPDLGKIDLVTKLRRGTVKLTTDMTGAPPATAVTPPTPYGQAPSADDATRTNYWSKAEGATDGSSAFWSGALSGAGDGTGTYQLELDRTYTLTKLGLALLPGARTGARVETSADGATWTPATLDYPTGVPASSTPGRIDTPGDRALRYYGLNATARFVRITTDATTCAVAGGPDKCSMINELELYSTVNSFENDAATPHGMSDVTCARLTQPAGTGDPSHDSQYAIRIKDQIDPGNCDGANKKAGFTYPGPGVNLPAETTRTLQAGIYPVSNVNGLLVDIFGKRADGGTGTVYHLGINNAGRWIVHSGGVWTGLGGAVVGLKTWTTLKVVATTTGATLYTVGADGQSTRIGTLPQEDATTSFSAITGYAFTSGSSPRTGDEAVIDDISFDRPDA
ncbi:discoidin domain-containing protein [Actinoplanes sp. NPDC048796]|uniref:discoidin domain-containing protein n=1 Tax=Actinoplanes sp. NPDC048796 TaxID=3155640 RepID=UPI0033F1108E